MPRTVSGTSVISLNSSIQNVGGGGPWGQGRAGGGVGRNKDTLKLHTTKRVGNCLQRCGRGLRKLTTGGAVSSD